MNNDFFNENKKESSYSFNFDPFEIKKTGNPTKAMIKNFEKLEETGKEIGPGGIICCYDMLMHLDEKNYIIPISSVINNKE